MEKLPERVAGLIAAMTLNEDVTARARFGVELKEAIRAIPSPAPAQAEPVAWVDSHELKNISAAFEPTISKEPVSEHDAPLYAAPQAPAVGAEPPTDEQIRERFEKAVAGSKLAATTPLGAMTINGVFSHYVDSDTDTLWISYRSGFRAAISKPPVHGTGEKP